MNCEIHSIAIDIVGVKPYMIYVLWDWFYFVLGRGTRENTANQLS